MLNSKKIILLINDIIIFYLSLYITLFLRYGQNFNFHIFKQHLSSFTIIAIIWIVIFYITNLYNFSLILNRSKFYKSSISAFIVCLILAISFFYFIPLSGITPKKNLFIFIVIFFILFYLEREIFAFFIRKAVPKNKITIIGYDEQIKQLIEEIKEKPYLGYQLVLNINNITDINKIKELQKKIEQNEISTIIIAQNANNDYLQKKLLNYLNLKIDFYKSTEFYELITGKIPVESIKQIWFLENLKKKRVFDLIKRVYDVVLSLIILIITFPFWPIIAIIIKIESHGPVFFKQIRAGKNNKLFYILKFRTMKVENEKYLTNLDSDGVKKIFQDNNKRVTKFGSFLRRFCIDEIPQTINILRNEMSFIGPRPEKPEFIKELEKSIPFYKQRMLIKPGITGWDQVSGEYHSPSKEDTLKKLQYDLFYIKNRSLSLDLYILFKTVRTILYRKEK